MAHDYTPQGCSSESYPPEGFVPESRAQCHPRHRSRRDHLPPAEVAGESGDGAVDGLEAGIEWGTDGALAQALLSAAITDVAPIEVRERVLAAVDAVLREPAAVPAFPADAAPVTTLSGVFEKRRPGSEGASCIEAPEGGKAFADVQDACFEPARRGGPALEAAALEPVCVEATFVESEDIDAASLGEGSLGEASLRAASSSAVSLEWSRFERRAPPVAGASPQCATARSGGHCHGGPMVGGRCRSTQPAVEALSGPVISGPVISGPVISGPVISGPVISGPVISGPISPIILDSVADSLAGGAPSRTPRSGKTFRVGAAGAVTSRLARASVGASASSSAPFLYPDTFGRARDAVLAAQLDAARDPDTALDLDVALTASERSTSARLRDGVVASAFNLAQLAAAIVVGIVIGKAAHLVIAEESAMAWSTSAEAEGGLRAEPSRAPDSDRASDPGVASEPLDSIEPGSARQGPRPRAASRGRAGSRANASSRRASAALARPVAPCTLASTHPAATAALAPALPPITPPVACATAVAGVGSAAVVTFRSGQRSQRFHAADNIQPPLAPASDDWLGEQLAILGRAERSLHDGDAESAVRSLDEYQARFPDGLLDPQMASIRQRVEERFTAFIFP